MSVVHRKPDFFRLAHLKKLRLALKDRIVGHIKSAPPKAEP
jgi:hypothetical protein